MAYRRPGTYARFVRTVSPAINAGGSRILGLVGTGINYFTIQNEAVLKSSSQPYDELAHKNVFEIISISSRPIYDNIITSENKVYKPHTVNKDGTVTQVGYTVNDNIISWDYLIEPNVSINYATCPKFYMNNGNINITAVVDDSAMYPVIDGNWVIEVSYINEEDQDAEYNNREKLGCYRIINADTSEIVGEYVVSDDPVVNEDGTYPIPGVMLTVKDTFITEDAFSTKPVVNVGDYITIKTVAAKTETEAKAYKQESNIEGNKYDLTLSVTGGEKDDPVKTPISLSWNDITGDADRYYIYAKTEEFEGSKNKPATYTKDLSDAYKIAVQGTLQYSFTLQDKLNASGFTTNFNNTFTFSIFDTTNYTDEQINAAILSNDGKLNPEDIATIRIQIENFDKNYQYYYQLVSGETQGDIIRLTTKTKNGINVSGMTGIKLFVCSFRDTKSNPVVCYDYYSIMDDGTEDNFAIENLESTVKSSKVSYGSKSVVVYANSNIGTTTLEASDVKTYNSTDYVFNFGDSIPDFDTATSGTGFYFLLVAIDENDNPVDFSYSDNAVYQNVIDNTGDKQTIPINVFGVVTAPDQTHTMSISATGDIATGGASEDSPSEQEQVNMFNAVTDVQVIANELLPDENMVYNIILVKDSNGDDKFRIVRFKKGLLDRSWLQYAGIESYEDNPNYYEADKTIKEPTLGGDDNKDYWLTYDGDGATSKSCIKGVKSRYLADIDEDMFDVIPGVSFKFDKDKIPNLAYGSNVIIVSTPRVVSNDVPAEGDTYYVTYKYRKSDADYDPIFFTDYDDIVATYGNYDVSASSAVLNSLSLAAEIAFNNGVSQIVCCQARNNSDYEMQSAIDRMRKEVAGAKNVSTIIPLTTSDAVGAYLQKHVDLMSSYDYGKERMGYLGARIGQKINKIATKNDRSLGMTTIAEGYDDERIVYVVPGGIKRQIRDLRTGKYNTRTLPSVYAAVAVASVGLSQDPAEPLTNKNISGFTELVDLFSESEKNILANSGCCVLEHNGQNIRIRHGITTNNNEVNSQEITLIQIKDYVIDGCRTVTGDTYIGRKLTATLIADIKYTMENLLNGYIAEGVIISYSSLKVKRNPDEPRQVDVSFEIEAVYPLNWISIEFGFSAVK